MTIEQAKAQVSERVEKFKPLNVFRLKAPWGNIPAGTVGIVRGSYADIYGVQTWGPDCAVYAVDFGEGCGGRCAWVPESLMELVP